MPTSTRAGTATGTAEVNASSSWPLTSSAPLTTSMALEPKRSTIRPAGICADTYTVT